MSDSKRRQLRDLYLAEIESNKLKSSEPVDPYAGDRRREIWRAHAVCLTDKGAHWFPDMRQETNPGAGGDYIRECRERCRLSCSVCPVAERCLDMALTEGHQDGIFADTSPSERNVILRGQGAHV